VSDVGGDGYGYDVQSFETDGQERLLEINTTCGNERTPFWMSKRECDVAAEKGDIYRVRRVFHFRNQVKMFDIAPPLEARLLLSRRRSWRRRDSGCHPLFSPGDGYGAQKIRVFAPTLPAAAMVVCNRWFNWRVSGTDLSLRRLS
jgi:Domain of unknown function (DUF3883)